MVVPQRTVTWRIFAIGGDRRLPLLMAHTSAIYELRNSEDHASLHGMDEAKPCMRVMPQDPSAGVTRAWGEQRIVFWCKPSKERSTL